MPTVSNTAIDLVVVGTRDATIASLYLNIDGFEVRADGTSKRDPQDSDDPEVAELLAAGRALEIAAAKLLKRANGLVKHQDDIKKIKEEQKRKANAAAKKSTVKARTKPLKSLAKAGSKK